MKETTYEHVFLWFPRKVITETLDSIPIKFNWKWLEVVEKVKNSAGHTVWFALDCYHD